MNGEETVSNVTADIAEKHGLVSFWVFDFVSFWVVGFLLLLIRTVGGSSVLLGVFCFSIAISENAFSEVISFIHCYRSITRRLLVSTIWFPVLLNTHPLLRYFLLTKALLFNYKL